MTTKRYSNHHKHKYILDENNFGVCKCGATKQFPSEKKLELRPSEVSFIEGLGPGFNPDTWLNASYNEKVT